MFAILPLISFIIFIIICHRKFGESELGFGKSYLTSMILLGLLITILTELLSALDAISFYPLLISWGLIVIIALYLCIRSFTGTYPNRRSNIAFLKTPDTFLMIGLAFIVSVELVICLVAPPNTADSMSYHMARVAHWIQNNNIDFFPTHVLRQIQHSPWSEFAILHLQVLSHGDRFANLIQWVCMIGSVIGSSVVAKRLGANKPGQLLTAVVTATIPMGILQASSTQTDYVVSFWLVCMVAFLLAMKKKESRFHSAAAGASLGLAILTKGVAYIIGFPFLLWWGIDQLRKSRQSFLRHSLLLVIIALSINGTHYFRNFALSKNPLGVTQGIVIDEISLQALYSNTIRNLGLHIGTPFPIINHFFEKQIYNIIGPDINDPQTTWKGEKFHVHPTSFYEDTAGNLFHMLLLITSFILLCITYPKIQKPTLFIYSALLIAAFLLLCLLLKWQPWNSRLHLPLFVLGAPIIGVVLSTVMGSKTTYSLAFMLILISLPWLFFNTTRPITGPNNIFTTPRIDQYFVNVPAFKEPFKKIAAEISSQQYKNVGFDTYTYATEYPFWVLLKDDNCRFEHVNVKNISKKIKRENFWPDVIISEKDGQIKLIRKVKNRT